MSVIPGCPSVEAAAAKYPSCFFFVVMDDTYIVAPDAATGLEALEYKQKMAREMCGLSSNNKKVEVFSHAGDLSAVPASFKGSPAHKGGRLSVVRIVGYYLGDSDAVRAMITLSKWSARTGACASYGK